MATISKESLAQFWLNTFPISSNYESISFSDSKAVQNLLEFVSDNSEEKKIFDIINGYIQETQPRKFLKTTAPKNSSPKRQRAKKNSLINIDPKLLRFNVHIDVVEILDYDEEVQTVVDTIVEDRSIENLSSMLNESDSNIIAKRFQKLIYPWLIDVSFQISNDIFSIIVELMNKNPDEFFLSCFVPWLNNQHVSTDNINLFLSNLFTQLTNISDRCTLCSYLCQNSTCPFNDNELCIISKWFDCKEFYFSSDLLNILPEKIATSAKIFSDSLPFAKVLHKVLIKCTENNHIITNEQRFILKQASNNKIFSIILSQYLSIIIIMFLVTFYSICILSCYAGILPSGTQNSHKARVLDLPLSQQEHFTDTNHDEKVEHNTAYDHEAFLGVEEAKKFEKLSVEESTKRLGALFDRIDKDHNGTVTKQELKDWIKSVQTRYITDDVERQWKQMNNDSNNAISWDEYDKTTYYALYDNTPEPDQVTEQYLRLQKKDRRRFTKADEDGNGSLNKNEFADFIHPEQSPRMKDLVITETIEDMDANKDGFISLEEFLHDIWDSTENNNTVEPEWVQTERENFLAYRDLDHDKKLNRKEVELWLMPVDYDNIEAETSHLFREADKDQDNQLTKEEILDKHDVFVGSQATDWGAELRVHQDL
ncbi:unnamed protein product [Rotaria socialis]